MHNFLSSRGRKWAENSAVMYANDSCFWRLNLINGLCKPERKFIANKMQNEFCLGIFLNDFYLLYA